MLLLFPPMVDYGASLIGDTEFTLISTLEFRFRQIQIAINAFGEELMIDNVETALKKVC